MGSFWSVLIAKIHAGEMDYDEALRRDNYYSFVMEMPTRPSNPRRYVLDTPYDELPPYTVCMNDEMGAAYRHFIECVRDGTLTPYEAAEEYHRMVGG